MKYFISVFVFFFSLPIAFPQSDPFQIFLQPFPIAGLPGVQSYAYAQHNGLWLIIGGRTDGLHRRQPWATFDPEGRNLQLTVIDPKEGQVWTAPLSTLSLPLQDQLSSTNMEFYQDGNVLYLVGGYGHSQTIDSKLTYALLTAVDVPGVIDAIRQKQPVVPFFRQIIDKKFAVTGGHLSKIGDTYYLVGGQKFDGNYNPMNHPSFTQEYTNSIRRFKIDDQGQTLSATHLPAITDTAAFHRRDFNVVPQIFPDGQEGLTAFSGVFQINADLPFLNCVNITDHHYTIDPEFAQYYNQYHCAKLPLYSASQNEMHTVFFGGIAQYIEQDGQLIADSDVPFVKTIARVSRDKNGSMREYKLPVSMPAYLGASAEFIPLPAIPMYENGVIKMDELNTDSTLVGYIYGGITSTAENIFWINEGTESSAYSNVFKVYVIKNTKGGSHTENPQSHNGFQLQVHTQTADELFVIRFHLTQKMPVTITITDAKGKKIWKETLANQLVAGNNTLERKVKPFIIGGTYLVSVSTTNATSSQKIIVKE